MKLRALILSTLDSGEYVSFTRRSLHTRRERQSVFINMVRFYVRNPTDRHAFWLVSIFPLSRIMQCGLFECSIDSETVNLMTPQACTKYCSVISREKTTWGDLIVDESTLFH
jgi:hypothetical protein